LPRNVQNHEIQDVPSLSEPLISESSSSLSVSNSSAIPKRKKKNQWMPSDEKQICSYSVIHSYSG
jgi:hypothetical protein